VVALKPRPARLRLADSQVDGGRAADLGVVDHLLAVPDNRDVGLILDRLALAGIARSGGMPSVAISLLLTASAGAYIQGHPASFCGSCA
jgi:hypothetical protein